MTAEGEPNVQFSVRELLQDLKDSQRLGFRGVHSRIDEVNQRLDKQNGRVRRTETDIANIKGRWLVVTLLTSILTGIGTALAVALLLRGGL